jgi:hypothetical protein
VRDAEASSVFKKNAVYKKYPEDQSPLRQGNPCKTPLDWLNAASCRVKRRRRINAADSAERFAEAWSFFETQRRSIVVAGCWRATAERCG